MSLKHPQKTESELISKRVENSKREIEKLKAEYEKLVQQGLVNSKSSTNSLISTSEVCVKSGGSSSNLKSVNNSETGTSKSCSPKTKPLSELTNNEREVTDILGSESDLKNNGILLKICDFKSQSTPFLITDLKIKATHSEISNKNYSSENFKTKSASVKEGICRSNISDTIKVTHGATQVDFNNHYLDDFDSKSLSFSKRLHSKESIQSKNLSDDSKSNFISVKSLSAISNDNLLLSGSNIKNNSHPSNVLINLISEQTGKLKNMIRSVKEEVKEVKPINNSSQSSVKKCSRSPTKYSDNNLCSSKNQKNYDVEEARKFMRKQKEKRLEQIRMKLKESVNTVEERKRKLKELNEKSLKIITKNRERSRSRSKETPRATDVMLHPLQSIDINKSSKAIIEKKASRERITVRSKYQEELPLQLTYRVKDDEVREKAAIVVQSHFRGYKQRMMYKQLLDAKIEHDFLSNEKDAMAKQIKDKKHFPEWLQVTQSYPYNFISAVKQKLNIAINTPPKTSDVAIQNTSQISHLRSKELKEKIEHSINRSSSQSDHVQVLNLKKTMEYNSAHTINSKDLKDKVAQTISGSENITSSNSDSNLTLKSLKKDINSRSENADLGQIIEKSIRTIHKHSPSSRKASKKMNLDLKAVESLKLKTRNTDKSGSDTSKNIPDLSTENSINSKHIKSISKDYSSSFEPQQVEKPSNVFLSADVLKSAYSQYSTLQGANSLVEEVRDSNTTIESFKTYSKKSGSLSLNLISSNNVQEDFFKKPQAITKKPKKDESDISLSKKSNKENSIPIISIKAITDIASDSDSDFKLEINTERLKKLRLLRRKVRHDEFDNTIELIGHFGNRKRSNSSELSYDIPLENNSKITSNVKHSIKYSANQISNNPGSMKSLESSVGDINKINTDFSEDIIETELIENDSVKSDDKLRPQEIVQSHSSNDLIIKSHTSNHSNNDDSLCHQSIHISSKGSYFSPDYSKHSYEGQDTFESESVQEDLVSFRDYIRDFKANGHHKEKKSSSETKVLAKNNTLSFRTMKSTSSESANDESNRSKGSENTTINDKLSSDVIDAVPLVAPIISLQSNCDSVREENVKDTNVKEVTLKAGEKEVINTMGTSNQIHVKFEAELHLLNDFNESLRQFMAVEKSLLDLQNKSNIQHETRDTQTSFLTKSTTEPIAVSTATETSAISSNILTVASLNYSRGSDFHHDKSSVTLNSFHEDSFANSEALNTNNSKLITENSILGNTVLDISDIKESATNDSRDKLSQVSQVIVNKDKKVYVGLSLGMFEQLIKDEDARIENLKTILKIREKALLDRTKGELAWLEIQKKHLLETGKLHEASLVKKKQRGILIKLQHEKHEMQKLKQIQKAASKERKTILKEQRNMIKTQLSMNSSVTKIKRTTSKERRASGPVKVYNYHRETVKSETSISKRSSLAEEVIYETHSESIVSKMGEVTEIGSTQSEGVEHKNMLVNTCTEIAKRSLLMREAALQRRRKAAEELLQWHQKLLEEERKITELEMAASNIINQVPTITIENSSTANGYKFLGSQLNVLWENMTGRAEKKFKDNENYNLSQIALERFCKDAKKYSNKNSDSEWSGAQERTSNHINPIIIDKNTLELEKGIKQSESTLNEIMQNISNITDEISELYKLSSTKTDQIPDELQSAMTMDLSINASISEDVKNMSHEKVPESSIESVSIKTTQSDRVVNSDDNYNSVKEIRNVNSENSMTSNLTISNGGELQSPHIVSTSSVPSNELKSNIAGESLNLVNAESEISEIPSNLLCEYRNRGVTKNLNKVVKQYPSENIIESLNKPSEKSIHKSTEILGKGQQLTQSVQEMKDGKSVLTSNTEKKGPQVVQNPNQSGYSEEAIESIKEISEEKNSESTQIKSFKQNEIKSPDGIQVPSNAESSTEESLISDISEQKELASKPAAVSEKYLNSSISDIDRSLNLMKDLSENSFNAHISLENQASSLISEETSDKKLSCMHELVIKSSESLHTIISHDDQSVSASKELSKKIPEEIYFHDVNKKTPTNTREKSLKPDEDLLHTQNSEDSQTTVDILEESLNEKLSFGFEEIYCGTAKRSQSDKSSSDNQIAFEINSNSNNKIPIKNISSGVIPDEIEEVGSLYIDNNKNISSEISVALKTLERHESENHAITKESLGKDAKNSHNTSVKQSVIVSKSHEEVESDNEDSSKVTDHLGDIDAEENSLLSKTSAIDNFEDKDGENEKKKLTSQRTKEIVRSERTEIEEDIAQWEQNEKENILLHEIYHSNFEQNIPLNMNSEEVDLQNELYGIGDLEKSINDTITDSHDADLISEYQTISQAKGDESHTQIISTVNCKGKENFDVLRLNNHFDFEVQMLKSNQCDGDFDLSTSNEYSRLDESKSEIKEITISDGDHFNDLKVSKGEFKIEVISCDKGRKSSDQSIENSDFNVTKSIESSPFHEHVISLYPSKCIESTEENLFELELEIKATNDASLDPQLNELSSTNSDNKSKFLSPDILLRCIDNETAEDKSTSPIVSEMSEHSQISSIDELSVPIIEVMIEEKKQKLKNLDLKNDEEDKEKSRLVISDSPKSLVNIKQRVSEILADANINMCIGDRSPRLQDLYVTTYDVITPEGSPELGSPVESKTLLSKDIYGNEAEELLRKQLAIEQEIKQLEQQQLPYLYMREIPNKPPPPYTPPVQAIPVMPPTVLPMTIEQIFTMTPYISKILFDAYKQNKLSSVTLPNDRIFDNVDKECGDFVFDLCKEIASEHYSQFKEVSSVSWMKCNNRRLGFKRELKQSELKNFLDKQLKETFGFEKVELTESMIIKWSRKKRDHVDELLVFESQAEEAEWTNYDQDELIVKNDVTQDILHVLLKETAEVFENILKKRTLRDVC